MTRQNETLVIHVNAFTGLIEYGYTALTAAVRAYAEGGPAVIPTQRIYSAAKVGEFIAANPSVPVRFLKV